MAALADEVGDVPVPQGRRGVGGGLQGLRPGQDSTAFSGADHVDTPVPLDRGGRAWRRGLQGFSQEQNSIAFRGADHGDIPVPLGRGAGRCLHAFSPGQGSSASSSMDRSFVAEGAFDGFFRTFAGVKKVRGPPASAEITRLVFFFTQRSRRALQLMESGGLWPWHFAG